MNEKSFEAKLARVSAPAPDPEARLRAKRAALEEFARVQAANPAAGKTSEAASKGLWDALRLFRDDSSHGSASMAWFVRRNLFAGVASACVVGLGIAMVWPIFSSYGDTRLFDESAATGDRRSETQAAESPPAAGAPEDGRASARAVRAARGWAKAAPLRLPTTSGAGEATRELAAVVVSAQRAKMQARWTIRARRCVGHRAITAEDIGQFPDRTSPRRCNASRGRSRRRARRRRHRRAPREAEEVDRYRRARIARPAAPHKGVRRRRQRVARAVCERPRVPVSPHRPRPSR